LNLELELMIEGYLSVLVVQNQAQVRGLIV